MEVEDVVLPYGKPEKLGVLRLRLLLLLEGILPVISDGSFAFGDVGMDVFGGCIEKVAMEDDAIGDGHWPSWVVVIGRSVLYW